MDDNIRFYVNGKGVSRGDFPGFLEGLDLYSDGSCFDPTHPLLARAGASVVQIDPTSGEEVRRVTAHVPVGCPQTAAYGEHFAFLLAVTFTAYYIAN